MEISNYNMTTIPQFVGRELGVSDWVTMSQDRINQFAACTGDQQWIHVDVDRAKRESPFGGPIAQRLGAGFVPVRKPGKLPAQTRREAYELEYGADALEIHADACLPSARVLIVDDVLATGGTADATRRLVESLDASVVGFSFLMSLSFLHGMTRLAGHNVSSVLTY